MVSPAYWVRESKLEIKIMLGMVAGDQSEVLEIVFSHACMQQLQTMTRSVHVSA